MKRKKAILFIKSIPADVKNHFRAHCARLNITMSKMIEEMIRREIMEPVEKGKRYRTLIKMARGILTEDLNLYKLTKKRIKRKSNED